MDAVTTNTFFGHLIANERAQRQMIQALTELLKEAMEGSEMASEDGETPDWYYEAKTLIKIQAKIKMENENRLFNEKNGHAEPIARTLTPEVANSDYSDVSMGPKSPSDGEYSEAELSRMFGDKAASKPNKKGLKEMSEDEINRVPVQDLQKLVTEAEAEEIRQDNSNEIYKVKARVANLAVSISGGNLTPVGTMMVNSFVHVVKDLYDFADTLTDKELGIRLSERIRRHESMPGNLISAASSGVKVKK